MDTYSTLREFADSWVLLMLFLFFLGVIVWVFRPGAGRSYDNPAGIPFRHDDRPAPRRGEDSAATRTGPDGKEA